MAEMWERQDKETSRAYIAFITYRDQKASVRSIANVPKIIGKTTGKNPVNNYEYLSKKYNWVERARAWDDHLDAIKVKSTESEIRDMKQRHIKIAMLMQKKGVDLLNKIDEDNISPSNIGTLLKNAIDIERSSRDVVGEDQTNTVQIEDWIKEWVKPKEN
jgi:hypothetical protein